MRACVLSGLLFSSGWHVPRLLTHVVLNLSLSLCCCDWCCRRCRRAVAVCVDSQIFFAFFLVAFFWFPIPNYFVPALFTMSMLCWGPHSWNPVLPFGRGGTKDLASVLGSGEAGAGMPGLGGWVSVWSYGPSVIPLQTTVWIVVGIILIYWIFVPVAFFSGLAAWPGSFREFNSNGSFYNQSEG